MILAGDVGGTKVDLALYDFIDGKLKQTRDKQYPAKEYSGLEEIVKEFIVSEKVTAACFGVPGPVRVRRSFCSCLSIFPLFLYVERCSKFRLDKVTALSNKGQ